MTRIRSACAATPVWDDLLRRYGYAQLQAAGEAVGLQPGKAGNSEAGHMNIGAGRVVLQDDVRLDQAMQDGSFATNEVLLRTILDVKRRGASLHLIGLLTERSSHGSIDYPLALLRMAAAAGLDRVYVHIIFDGRSTEPGSAPARWRSWNARSPRSASGRSSPAWAAASRSTATATMPRPAARTRRSWMGWGRLYTPIEACSERPPWYAEGLSRR